MSEESEHNVIIKLLFEISSMNANLKCALDRIENHESRIAKLEDSRQIEAGKQMSLKDEMLKLLAKGLVGAVLIIGSLSGAGALLKGIFGL